MSTIPSERWLPVAGYEGYYEVSDFGRVRSLSRWVRYSNGSLRRYPGRLIVQGVNPRGYLTVCLCRKGRQRTRRVHILVLTAFEGPRPAGQLARHGAAGKLVNHWPGNLCWGTGSENQSDRLRDGTDAHGEHSHFAKLTGAAVAEIRQRVADGETQRAVARRHGVHFSTVNLIVRGKTWTHVS